MSSVAVEVNMLAIWRFWIYKVYYRYMYICWQRLRQVKVSAMILDISYCSGSIRTDMGRWSLTDMNMCYIEQKVIGLLS